MRGNRDANLFFEDLRRYLSVLGFEERIRGSHPIFTWPGLHRPLNLQPLGRGCKSYQIRQVRNILAILNLRL